jgi:hypothetical protein
MKASDLPILAIALLGCLSVACIPQDEADQVTESGERADDPGDEEFQGICNAETECDQEITPTENECVFFIGFDGSGVYSPDDDTNIGRLYEATHGPAAASRNGLRAGKVSADTTRAYIEGVPGLPFGASAERVDRGVSAVCQHLDKRPKPCDIVMMGYSRGAIIANMVAHAINDDGCGGGDHKGAEIAFFGAFDPVDTQMGSEWDDEDGDSQSWGHRIPSNVLRFQQVYKDPKTDPRGWPESATLTSTPHIADAVVSQCSRGLTSSEHSDGDDWHHGQIGHGTLPREIMLCALEKHGISLSKDRTQTPQRSE